MPSWTFTSSSLSSLSSSLKRHQLSFGQNTGFTLSRWGQSDLWSHSRRYRQGTSFSSFSRIRLLLWWWTHSRCFECWAWKWNWWLTHKRAFCSDLTRLHLQVKRRNSRSKQEEGTWAGVPCRHYGTQRFALFYSLLKSAGAGYNLTFSSCSALPKSGLWRLQTFFSNNTGRL